MYAASPQRQALRTARRSRILADEGAKAMGSPADYTIIVLLVAVGVGLWTLLDRVIQLQRDVEALKRKLGVVDPPSAD